MSLAVDEELHGELPEMEEAGERPRADTLAASVVILLLMTVAQRLIGFGRGIMFCRWLEPEELGQWDVAFGFLNLAAPLVVLGLPGSFGRYVEYFRQRGNFHVFLRRTGLVSLVASAAALTVMVWQRAWFSELIFGTRDGTDMVGWLALTLAVIILHNSLCALFIAVRMYRIVTVLQFVQSLGFALLSLGFLAVRPSGAMSVVIAFGLATVFSALGSYHWLRRLSAGEVDHGRPIPQRAFWAKLVPFALWMWTANLLANLFEVIDRYMIIHHSGMAVNDALREVGFYHSSRIVPLLFVAVAGLLGSLVTPHLSQDWELGRRQSVERRLNLMLKLLMLSLFAASVVVLFAAPLLFHVGFQNKFAGGLAVLPWTLAYCAWFGTIAVAQNYLWCAERPWLNSVALFLGLIVNIACNLVLLPRFGLEGAVWATTVANFAALAMVYLFSRLNGMAIDSGTVLASLLPVTLGLGAWPAAAVLLVALAGVVSSNWILSRDEKRQLLAAGEHACHRLHGMWPNRLRRASGGA